MSVPATASSVWRCPRRPLWWLAGLCLLLYLPGLFTLPPTDRDESRFAQASKQMLESGDFLDIRFQETSRYKKPAGIYWLQSASMAAAHKVFGTPLNAIWPYRVPSALAAMLGVLLFFLLLRSSAGVAAAFWAAVLLAPCLLLVVEAHIAKTDAALFMVAILQQGALARLYHAWRGGEPAAGRWRLLFWGAMGAGIMLKGPVIPVLAVTTLLFLRGVYKAKGFINGYLRPLPWVMLPVVLVVPWLWAIQVHSDGAFLRESLGHDFFAKLGEGQESHGAPPGYYLLLSPLLLWPSSLVVLPLLTMWRQIRAHPIAPFVIAWALPYWLLLELTSTKLPHYLLPMAPALCLLAALSLTQGMQHSALSQRWLAYSIAGVWTVGCLALAVAVPGLPLLREGYLPPLTLAAPLALAGMLALALRRRLQPGSLIAGALCAVTVYAATFAATLPSLRSVFFSESVCAAANGRLVASSGYSEPSLIYLCGTETRLLTTPEAFEFLYRDAPDGLVVIEQKEQPLFEKMRRAAPHLDIRLEQVLRGFQYNEGEETRLYLYSRTR